MRPALLWYQDSIDGRISQSGMIDGIPIEHIRKGNTMYGFRLMDTETRQYHDSGFVPGARLSGRNKTER